MFGQPSALVGCKVEPKEFLGPAGAWQVAVGLDLLQVALHRGANLLLNGVAQLERLVDRAFTEAHQHLSTDTKFAQTTHTKK